MKKIIFLLNMIIIILLGVSCGNNDENRYLKDQFLTGFKEHHGSDYKSYDVWYNLITTDVISNLDKTRTKVVRVETYMLISINRIVIAHVLTHITFMKLKNYVRMDYIQEKDL